MEEEQASGKGGIREKAASAKERAVTAKDAATERGRQGFSTVKDAATTAKDAVAAFADEAKRQDLQGSTKQAIQKAGEASREVGEAAKGEIRQTRESLQGSASTDSSGS